MRIVKKLKSNLDLERIVAFTLIIVIISFIIPRDFLGVNEGMIKIVQIMRWILFIVLIVWLYRRSKKSK